MVSLLIVRALLQIGVSLLAGLYSSTARVVYQYFVPGILFQVYRYIPSTLSGMPSTLFHGMFGQGTFAYTVKIIPYQDSKYAKCHTKYSVRYIPSTLFHGVFDQGMFAHSVKIIPVCQGYCLLPVSITLCQGVAVCSVCLRANNGRLSGEHRSLRLFLRQSQKEKEQEEKKRSSA